MAAGGWRKGRLAALGVAGLCLLALAGWLCLGPLLGRAPGLPGPGGLDGAGDRAGGAGGAGEAGNGAPGPAGGPVTSVAGGRILLTTLYLGCGHREQVSGLAPPGLLGQGEEALSRAFPGCTVEVRGGVVRVSRVQEGFCPEDNVFRHLGVVAGRVAVFYGLPRPDPVLKQLTSVEVSRLTAQDRSRLEQGMVVAAGDDAIKACLEGLGE